MHNITAPAASGLVIGWNQKKLKIAIKKNSAPQFPSNRNFSYSEFVNKFVSELKKIGQFTILRV